MIKIESKKNKFTYNVYHVTKAFYPKEDIVQTVDEKQEPLVKIHLPEGTCFSLAPEECVQTEDVQEEKRDVTKKVYQFLSKQTGQELAWGMLTGVRPTKLVMQKIEQGMTKEEIFGFLKEQYCVTDKKAQIAYEIACREKALLDRLDCQNGYSLYAGIPFCPSICSYCSFSSSPIAEWKDQVDRYLDAMIKELKATAKLMQGKPLDTVYIGGGTPTTLEADQLDRLLGTIREDFDLEHVLEFTVEAGRPDSITREKLEVIRKYPVTRISVNPQTFSDETLARVGRAHTGADTVRAFELAREMGFQDINMDLIAALPGETPEIFARSIEKVIELSPDSVTVHALAIKRSSRLHEQMHVQNGAHGQVSAASAQEMIDLARERLTGAGWKPYYLYRQKYMAGNLENVGYAKPGKACLYNIGNMEETASVLALGAGAISKWLFNQDERAVLSGYDPELLRFSNIQLRIERAANVRNIEQYVSRVDEMIARKREMIFPEARA